MNVYAQKRPISDLTNNYDLIINVADVPQVKTYINAYDNHEHTLSAIVDKLFGRSEFEGVSPVDAFCGFIDTRM